MHGLHVIEKKVEAIKIAPAPENQHQLRSFLGMVNYYAKFVSNYSTAVHPLNDLLHHNVKWKWTKKENDAFCALKSKLSTAPVLTHFRSDLLLKLDIGRGLLCQKVARNVFSWHPSEKHLVYDLFERHIGTLQPKKVPKPKTCPIPRKQLICHYVILTVLQRKNVKFCIQR